MINASNTVFTLSQLIKPKSGSVSRGASSARHEVLPVPTLSISTSTMMAIKS